MKMKKKKKNKKKKKKKKKKMMMIIGETMHNVSFRPLANMSLGGFSRKSHSVANVLYLSNCIASLAHCLVRDAKTRPVGRFYRTRRSSLRFVQPH